MRYTLFLLLFFTMLLSSHAQDDILAQQYFDDGEYQKALIAYDKLYKESPRRIDFFVKSIACHQQLENFKTAEGLLIKALEKPKYSPILLVETGFNYDLQQDSINAKKYYDLAVKKVEEKPSLGYPIAKTFEKKSLLDYALHAYKTTMAANPNLNYEHFVARIYGEKGEIEKMFSTYLDLVLKRESRKGYAQRIMSQFLRNDPDNENNVLLRKILLKRNQQEPNLLWNELLSWLFIQQKQYNRAFIQEKAIYKKGDASLQRIFDLALLSLEDKDRETTKNILNYIIENSSQVGTKLMAYQNVLQIEIEEVADGNYDEIEKQYLALLEEYGKNYKTVLIQKDYANLLAFQKNQPEQAIAYLRDALTKKLSTRQKAALKLALGDILVYQEQFNQALIYFSQVQKILKNDVVGQRARFKVAKTSYYKGDFQWAESQLKVLKSSVSQLIANDALQLKLIISDNSLEDSTQTALKKYAKADLLAYQNKNEEAITVLEDILQNHKGEKIEDEALLMQGKLYQNKGDFEKARQNYKKIIAFYGTDILADDAHFKLAQLFEYELDDEAKAKAHYEEIIFNHQDSIHFVEAQKAYRKLRGDIVN